jgi:hypothetical protein
MHCCEAARIKEQADIRQLFITWEVYWSKHNLKFIQR